MQYTCIHRNSQVNWRIKYQFKCQLPNIAKKSNTIKAKEREKKVKQVCDVS